MLCRRASSQHWKPWIAKAASCTAMLRIMNSMPSSVGWVPSSAPELRPTLRHRGSLPFTKEGICWDGATRLVVCTMHDTSRPCTKTDGQ
jgi:hypothetical protein